MARVIVEVDVVFGIEFYGSVNRSRVIGKGTEGQAEVRDGVCAAGEGTLPYLERAEGARLGSRALDLRLRTRREPATFTMPRAQLRGPLRPRQHLHVRRRCADLDRSQTEGVLRRDCLWETP